MERTRESGTGTQKQQVTRTYTHHVEQKNQIQFKKCISFKKQASKQLAQDNHFIYLFNTVII